MKWFQSKYDKQHKIERWFLEVPEDAEWFASVVRCKNIETGIALPRWVAIISPDDQTRESDSEYFSARKYGSLQKALEVAQRWAEMEMKLDRRID
ncbi:MAG: hypothetical protein WAL96_03690 [Candidatus Sulfotelmatobacter sp.]